MNRLVSILILGLVAGGTRADGPTGSNQHCLAYFRIDSVPRLTSFAVRAGVEPASPCEVLSAIWNLADGIEGAVISLDHRPWFALVGRAKLTITFDELVAALRPEARSLSNVSHRTVSVRQGDRVQYYVDEANAVGFTTDEAGLTWLASHAPGGAVPLAGADLGARIAPPKSPPADAVFAITVEQMLTERDTDGSEADWKRALRDFGFDGLTHVTGSVTLTPSHVLFETCFHRTETATTRPSLIGSSAIDLASRADSGDLWQLRVDWPSAATSTLTRGDDGRALGAAATRIGQLLEPPVSVVRLGGDGHVFRVHPRDNVSFDQLRGHLGTGFVESYASDVIWSCPDFALARVANDIVIARDTATLATYLRFPEAESSARLVDALRASRAAVANTSTGGWIGVTRANGAFGPWGTILRLGAEIPRMKPFINALPLKLKEKPGTDAPCFHHACSTGTGLRVTSVALPLSEESPVNVAECVARLVEIPESDRDLRLARFIQDLVKTIGPADGARLLGVSGEVVRALSERGLPELALRLWDHAVAAVGPERTRQLDAWIHIVSRGVFRDSGDVNGLRTHAFEILRSLEASRSKFHEAAIATRGRLAMILIDVGDDAGVADSLDGVLERLASLDGFDRVACASLLAYRASAHRGLAEYEDAAAMIRRERDVLRAAAADDVRLRLAAENLASVLIEAGQLDAGARELEVVSNEWRVYEGEESPGFAWCRVLRSRLLHARGEYGPAAEEARAGAVLLRRASDIRSEARALFEEGRALASLGNSREAQRAFRECLDRWDRVPFASRPERGRCRVRLAHLLRGAGKERESAQLLEAAQADLSGLRPDHPWRVEAELR